MHNKQIVQYADYIIAFRHAVMKAYGKDAIKVDQANAPVILALFSTEMLKAIRDDRVVEDNSIITNNKNAGLSVNFYPFYKQAAEMELAERMMLGDESLCDSETI